MTRYTATTAATLAFALAIMAFAIMVVGITPAAPAGIVLVIAATPLVAITAKELWIIATR